MTLFLSTALHSDIAQSLGAPHYSYHFAATAFRTLLSANGHPSTLLPMPEYYATAAALPVPPNGRPIHLIFRSTEQLRLLKPAANICCFAWEFPVLRADTLPGDHPFDNQCAMLAMCDEIWTPSTFAADTLRAHGLTNVQRIPAPITPPPRGRIPRTRARAILAALAATTLDINFIWNEAVQQAQAERHLTTLGAFLDAAPRRSTIVLAVLNPEDFRKNLDAMLRGFAMLRATNPAARLIVKLLTAASRFGLAAAAGGVIRNKLAPGTVLADDGIAFINDYLTDAQMTALYSLADFYLCTSIAEGQNLPLLEAMAHGTIAVSTRNTAMLDYLTDANSTAIHATTVTNTEIHLAGTHARRTFEIAQCSAHDVHGALQAALRIPTQTRTEMAKSGIDTVTTQFGSAAVWPLIQSRLAHHAAPPP